MHSKFFKLSPEKRDRIINAAIKEFAQKGYINASTNEIVKSAEISKGLLFHYFRNKKQLFLFLFDYCIELITNEFYKVIDLTDPDLFARITKASMIKMELLNQYPGLFKFVEIAYLEDANEVKEELAARIKQLTDINFRKIYHGIDLSKFKDGIDIQKAIKTITWTLEGLSAEVMQQAKRTLGKQIDYDKVFQEAEGYVNLLKTCFYK
jgi:TetR/AcrR family transcriptional regulator